MADPVGAHPHHRFVDLSVQPGVISHKQIHEIHKDSVVALLTRG